MLKSKHIQTLLCAALLIAAPLLQAQMVGSPINTPGSSQWTVSAMGGYFYQEVGNVEQVQSYRVMMKSSWGVTPWLDLFALGGASDLRIETSDAATSVLEDDMRLTYGLGLNFSMPVMENGVSLWAGAHAIRYEPRGQFSKDALIDDALYTYRTEMKYDWRELKAFAGITVPLGKARFYAGGAGWWLQRLEDKTVYLEQNQSSTVISGPVEGDFRSGMWTGALVGVEIRLPDNFAIALEAMLFNESNMQVYVSILQTGASGWTPLD